MVDDVADHHRSHWLITGASTEGEEEREEEWSEEGERRIEE